MINKKVLLLNQSYEPLMITNVKRAIILIMNKKVDLVEKYNDYIYTINSSLVAPSVIKLKYYIRFRKTIAPNRKNILKRDNYMCQYCMRVNVSLTIDHVIPKDKGGSEKWENLVAACSDCNSKKSNKLLKQTNMKLYKKPMKPSHLFYFQKHAYEYQTSWKPYLFMN